MSYFKTHGLIPPAHISNVLDLAAANTEIPMPEDAMAEAMQGVQD
jgi:hypothetical protein